MACLVVKSNYYIKRLNNFLRHKGTYLGNKILRYIIILCNNVLRYVSALSPTDPIYNVQEFFGKHLLGVVLAAKGALYVVVLAA